MTGIEWAPSLYTVGWVAWGVIFAVLEGMALANSKDGDTLSEHVWAYMGLDVRRGGRDPRQPKGNVRLRRFSVLALMAWLTLHFVTGGAY